ncbi:MAG: hypothetical protein U0984_02440, partial [Prosthecobacter sp.]|nr:hypothetical protein [Prosthecobacter sp.]
MLPLENPRHEAFAFALATGSIPSDAYRSVGYSAKNCKVRALDLVRRPGVIERINFLLEHLPHASQLRWLHAPEFTTMPESVEQMSAWLWQAMNGSRKLTSTQWQAAKLYSKLHKWGPILPGKYASSMVMTESSRRSLALLNAVRVAQENQLQTASPFATEAEEEADAEETLRRYHEAQAMGTDGSRADARQPAAGCPQGEDEGGEDEATTWEGSKTNGAMGTNGDSNPHAQPLEPQSTAPESAENGDQNKTSPSDSTLAFQSRAEPTPDDASAQNRPSPQALNPEPLNLWTYVVYADGKSWVNYPKEKE